MLELFRNRPGKERLEFGLMVTMIAVCMVAVAAILFGG